MVGRAAVGGAAELGDRDRLALRDQRPDALLVDVGDLLRAVGVDRDDVERRPVDALERDGGVGDFAAEPLADLGDGLGEKVVDAGGQPGQQLGSLRLSPEQIADPLLEAVAGQEPAVEQAQLGAGDEHDLGSPAADPRGALRAVCEQVEHLLGAELVGERREPDLKAQIGGVARGELEPVQVVAEQTHRGAVQVVADDLQLAPDDLVIERPAGDAATFAAYTGYRAVPNITYTTASGVELKLDFYGPARPRIGCRHTGYPPVEAPRGTWQIEGSVR